MQSLRAYLSVAMLVAIITAAAAAQSEPPPKRVRISGGVIAGNIIKKVIPECPIEIRRQHISCMAVFYVVIGTDGHILNAEGLSGNPDVQAAFIKAVRQWVYKPYLVDGEPVEVETTIMMILDYGALPEETSTAQQGAAPVELSTLSPNLVLPDDPSKPVRVSGGIIAGTLIKMTLPVFPPKTGCLHMSHTVVMRVIIGKDGHMKSVEVVSGADPLRQPTVNAVKQWVYKPFQLNGQPVDVETTVVSNPNLNCDGG